jgi:hypothetical protein
MESEAPGTQKQACGLRPSSPARSTRLPPDAHVARSAASSSGVYLRAGGAPSPSCRRRARTCSTGRRTRRASSVAGTPARVASRSTASLSSDHSPARRRELRPSFARRAPTASSERPSSLAITASGAPSAYSWRSRASWSVRQRAAMSTPIRCHAPEPSLSSRTMIASTTPVTARSTAMTGIRIHQRSTLPTRQTSATISSVAAVNMARSEIPRSRIGDDSLLGTADADAGVGRCAPRFGRGRAGTEVRGVRPTCGAAVCRECGSGCRRRLRPCSTSTSFLHYHCVK